ncbi:hypothetical protein K439DRAFT_1616299 [Ramaria rubella]|nr:hypothetical protein K439DRAFT_1616299 [Ramaria rubella]
MASTLYTIFCMPPDGEDSEEDFTADLNPADANLSDSGGGDCAVDASKEGKGATSYKRIHSEQAQRFRGQFSPSHRMSNKRSNSASRIRNHIGPRIFNCQPDQFSRPEWRYENCQELIGWQAGVNGPVFYSLLAPILYRNYEGRHDMKKVFLNQSLFNIFNVIIHGPGALNREPGAKSTKGVVMNNIIWELKEVMPGAIAASAVFACFALSNDLSFQRQGSASGINYEADFNTYLKYLISSRTQNWHSIKQIFSIWNNYFFPGIIRIEAIGAVPAHALDNVFVALDEDSSGDK